MLGLLRKPNSIFSFYDLQESLNILVKQKVIQDFVLDRNEKKVSVVLNNASTIDYFYPFNKKTDKSRNLFRIETNSNQLNRKAILKKRMVFLLFGFRFVSYYGAFLDCYTHRQLAPGRPVISKKQFESLMNEMKIPHELRSILEENKALGFFEKQAYLC